MSYVIFSIDNESNPMALKAFEGYIHDIQFDCASDLYTKLVGCYKGQKENAWIWSLEDFNKHLRGRVWIAEQESILHVASGNKMEATLEYLDNTPNVELGCMHQVCRAEALASEAYTYRPDLDIYWVAKHGNPDDSFKRSKKEFESMDEITEMTARNTVRVAKTMRAIMALAEDSDLRVTHYSPDKITISDDWDTDTLFIGVDALLVYNSDKEWNVVPLDEIDRDYVAV